MLTREQLENTIRDTVRYWHGMTEENAIAALDDVIEILLKKDHDYGSGNLYKTGIVGILVRMMDKTTRLDNLQGKPALVANEPITDTFHDTIGYALRGLILQKESEDGRQG